MKIERQLNNNMLFGKKVDSSTIIIAGIKGYVVDGERMVGHGREVFSHRCG